MKLISWNVNGLRSVHQKGLFVPFVEKYQPDILCLQETKAIQGQAEIDLPKYEEYWNSAERKGYSGTAIFVKKEYKPQTVLLGLPDDLCEKYRLHTDNYGDPNAEGRVIALEMGPPAGGFYLINSYTPNAKPDLSRLKLRHEQWDPAFLAYMRRLEEHGSANSPQGKPVIFCGDLNVAHTPDDLANPKQNEGEHGFTKEEREGIDKILASGFVDSFRHFTKGNGHYTYWAPWRQLRERNIGWRIDYFFVSKHLISKVKGAKILKEVLGSDHCPILLELH